MSPRRPRSYKLHGRYIQDTTASPQSVVAAQLIVDQSERHTQYSVIEILTNCYSKL